MDVEQMRVMRVGGRRKEADGVIALALTDPEGEALSPWAPGAHIDLVLSDDIVRQYSLTGDATESGVWEIAILLEPEGRGGSRQVFSMLLEGASVAVRGPRNHFTLESAQRYRFVAGGIGITPIRAMVAQAERDGADWQLLYGGRSRASMAYAAELHDLYGDRVLLRPEDEHGLLDLPGFIGAHAEGTLAYACGPEPMLRAFQGACAEWPASSVHVERFAPVSLGDVVNRPFQVELALSGLTLDVPADRSILEVVEAAGVFVTSSCSEGTCGSCEAGVIDGEPEHRDSVLTEAEHEVSESMMICVSRCRGDRLVLEL